jgi:hypothetical protein
LLRHAPPLPLPAISKNDGLQYQKSPANWLNKQKMPLDQKAKGHFKF